METKVGQVAFISREYIVAEILGGPAGELRPIGFSIFGPGFQAWTIYPDKEAALAEAQRTIAQRTGSPA